MYGGTGINPGQDNFGDLWVFEFDKLRFREMLFQKSQLPPSMYGHSLNYHGNALYLFGGTNGFAFYQHLFRFDLFSHQWLKIEC